MVNIERKQTCNDQILESGGGEAGEAGWQPNGSFNNTEQTIGLPVLQLEFCNHLSGSPHQNLLLYLWILESKNICWPEVV